MYICSRRGTYVQLTYEAEPENPLQNMEIDSSVVIGGCC
jgi:hypothetical protein